MLNILLLIVVLVGFGYYILFWSEWGVSYYNEPLDGSYVHTNSWNIIVKKIQRRRSDEMTKKKYQNRRWTHDDSLHLLLFLVLIIISIVVTITYHWIIGLMIFICFSLPFHIWDEKKQKNLELYVFIWVALKRVFYKTQAVKKNYPLKNLRRQVERLHLLDDVEEDAEFFDDDLGYCLLADRLDLLVKKDEIVGAILYASWHALEEGEQPGVYTEVQNIKVQLSAVVAQKLVESLEENHE